MRHTRNALVRFLRGSARFSPDNRLWEKPGFGAFSPMFCGAHQGPVWKEGARWCPKCFSSEVYELEPGEHYTAMWKVV